MTADPTQAFRLDDRVAIVTVASSGLGERFARVLSAAGARVVITARRADRLDALASDLPDALVVPGDITHDAMAGQLVDAALERYGPLDIVVNNAGASDPTPALEEPLRRRRLDLHLRPAHPALVLRSLRMRNRCRTRPRLWGDASD